MRLRAWDLPPGAPRFPGKRGPCRRAYDTHTFLGSARNDVAARSPVRGLPGQALAKRRAQGPLGDCSVRQRNVASTTSARRQLV